MNKSTRKLQFDTKTKKLIAERDEDCIFCRKGYKVATGYHVADTQIFDIMHVVNKSQGGMGVEKNGVLGCRYHHFMMDNGNKGNGKEMREICEEYLADYYGSWSAEEVTLSKDQWLSVGLLYV